MRSCVENFKEFFFKHRKITFGSCFEGTHSSVGKVNRIGFFHICYVEVSDGIGVGGSHGKRQQRV